MSPLRILLLCDDHPDHATTLHEHLDAFDRYSRHSITRLNPVGLHEHPLFDAIDDFDVVVLHWSLVITYDTYLAPSVRTLIHASRALKIQFIQDEYRWVDSITRMMRYLGVEVIYSVAPRAVAEGLYGSRVPGAVVRPTLTGFVPESLETLTTPPSSERPLDIVYRGRELPWWLGRLAHEKYAIGVEVAARAPAAGLRVDVSSAEGDRIYGDAWLSFLMSGRATLATPSGASITDIDGSIQARVGAYRRRHRDATFEDAERAVLRRFEGNLVIDVVSPRIFEAAAARTALVVFDGSYSGVLDVGRHAFVLERDFSNFDEIARIVRDPATLAERTEAAHADLIGSGRYSLANFVHDFDNGVDADLGTRPAVDEWRGPAPAGDPVSLVAARRWRRLTGTLRRRLRTHPAPRRT